MLNALLDINQIEAGVVRPNRVIFPLADMFERLRDEFSYIAQSRNLSLRVVPTTALVYSDPRLLEQIIRNLLGNAMKYTEDGKVLLGVRRCGDSLRIEVGDTGIGIAKDQLQAIFEEFHQVGNEARERSRGLGLGLSIVQRLGHLLGHAVDVSSVPGRGSLFAVTVPLRHGALSSPARLALRDERDQGEPPQRCKIVIVDDEPDILELLGQLLRADGYFVRVATDAAAALQLVAHGAVLPEILLTDYNLPGGVSGLELVGRMRALLKSDIPAIILTGDISTATMAKIAGEDCIQLSKPVNPEELTRALERLSPTADLPSAPVAADSASAAAAVTYIIDDDPAIRTALCEVLDGHGRTAHAFASAEAFLTAYHAGGEGCLLVDAHLPGMSGIELLQALRARGDNIPVILITGDGDIGLAVAAMRAGACEFIEKPVGRAGLLASVTRAMAQSHDIRLVDAVHEGAVALVAELTARQREIMGLVLAGHPSKNIAADLGISQRTVENHRAAIMDRMGVKSLPELARLVVRAETGAG
jgi:two-component system CheB/CheR fusion protein